VYTILINITMISVASSIETYKIWYQNQNVDSFILHLYGPTGCVVYNMGTQVLLRID